MKITVNKYVAAEYELRVDAAAEGGELELMERATKEEPLTFIFGVNMMLPKFEEHLFGLQKGDKFDFTINNEDAYGPYMDENVIDLDRSIFEIDGKLDTEMIAEGNMVPLMDSDGNRLNAQIVKVGADKVTVDLNHPLAGETLHFKGSILEVRDATEQELASLMGGGCGCGGCDDGDCDSDDGCGCGGCH
ncbi:peptidylprolyl isomerase [Paludibacter sp. 221]|uniref:FKBP-type peptidyl-prolyl cis-trans isomerase n=1 Tax=Paludibacter sp. 221 TaxID=2302939 RepID=UPI0013D05DBB|nr:FKBP-type peptidyl-prolyl cis-trans isomerase [Paludibacter sp. 221]NDV46787.1 peptidylprolyl isomerase [Paludibacter sp. 221]